MSATSQKHGKELSKRTVERPVAKKKATPMEMPVVSFAETEEWSAWLASRHHSSTGVWVKIAEKASGQAARVETDIRVR
jgi:hypothetical protein